MLTSFLKSYSQEYEINLSPEGKLETIYDNQGNQFKLKDILINAPKNSGVLNTTNLNCSTYILNLVVVWKTLQIQYTMYDVQ